MSESTSFYVSAILAARRAATHKIDPARIGHSRECLKMSRLDPESMGYRAAVHRSGARQAAAVLFRTQSALSTTEALTFTSSPATISKMCGRYKHCDLIDLVPACPGSLHATARDRAAYHFVFDPVADARNFRPAKRKQPRRGFRDDQKCSACALSMYETEHQARAMIDYLTKGHKRALPSEMGTHLAHAALAATSGESTEADEYGHYQFFEYVDCDSTVEFTIVGQL